MKKSLIFITAFLIAFHGIAFAQQQEAWSLEACIKYAIDHNIQIKQQTVQTEVQKNNLEQSKLNLLPTINGQLSHDYSFGRALDQNTYRYFNQTVQSDMFYLGGSTNVFSGLQNLNTIHKNKYELLAGEQDLQSIRDNVSLNVALAYLQILLNKELVAANENQLNITLQQIEKSKKLVDAGSVARGNLLQIEAQAAQEELNLITMKHQLEISYLNLTQLLELESPAGFEIIIPEINVEKSLLLPVMSMKYLVLQPNPDLR